VAPRLLISGSSRLAHIATASSEMGPGCTRMRSRKETSAARYRAPPASPPPPAPRRPGYDAAFAVGAATG
jgi:hypothetical protein